MTRLRQLMIEELRRRNFADSTIRSYIHGMEHFSQSIDVPISLALAALPMLFDWMVVGQVMPVNPAHAVRGPKHTQRRGRRECSRIHRTDSKRIRGSRSTRRKDG